MNEKARPTTIATFEKKKRLPADITGQPPHLFPLLATHPLNTSVDLPNHNFGCPEGACVSPRASEGERRTEITKITKTYAQTKQKDGKQQKKKKKKSEPAICMASYAVSGRVCTIVEGIISTVPSSRSSRFSGILSIRRSVVAGIPATSKSVTDAPCPHSQLLLSLNLRL